MANKTIPKGAMPEKEWYTLQEVAGRWTRMTGQAVGIDDILHYGKTGKLKISAELPEMGVDRRHIGSDDPIKHFLLGRGVYVLPQETVVGAIAQGRYPFGWLQSTEGAMVIYTPADDAPKILITKESLLVRIEDIQDFEQAHGLGQPVQNETKPKITEESAKPVPAQDDWIDRARELYRELKEMHPRLNKGQIAEKIALKLSEERYSGRGKKPLTAGNIARRALQNM